MKRWIFFGFLLLLVCASCDAPIPREAEQEFDFPVFVDTSNFDSRYQIIAKHEGTHYPMFFGKWKDSVTVFHYLLPVEDSTDGPFRYQQPPEEFKKYFIEWPEKTSLESSNTAQLGLFVDINQKIQNFSKEGYPVMIQNQSFDTVEVGRRYYIPIVLEARDKRGEWRQMEYEHAFQCGDGIGAIILPPEEFVVTSVEKTHGNFATKLRLRMGDNLSSEYKGNVDTLQFM